MHKIQIDASPAQLRKLKKGHPVRVKKGEGFELLVHPHTYNIVSRSFNKGKGSQIQLSPEELEMNQGISKAISPESHAPRTSMKTPITTTTPNVPAPVAGSGFTSKLQLADTLNKHLGTNYGYLARAGMDNAINSKISAGMSRLGIDGRMKMSPQGNFSATLEPHARMVGGAIEKGSVGRKGGMIHAYTPPALVSQPFSANFQFQHFLPPQYQHFNTGGHADVMGNGLYV